MQDIGPNLPTIGIIAGAGPDAGLVFWRKLLAAKRCMLGSDYRGDLDAPRVRVISEPALGHVLQLATHRQLIAAKLAKALAELDAVSDCIVLVCHALQQLVIEANPCITDRKLLSLPDLAYRYVLSSGLKSIALLGAPSITADLHDSPYTRLWEIAEIETPLDPSEVLSLISSIKRSGANHPDNVDRFLRLVSSFSCSTVVLACTDFSEMPTHSGKNVVDILDLAVSAALTVVSFEVSPPVLEQLKI